jgi:hypothetical protein
VLNSLTGRPDRVGKILQLSDDDEKVKSLMSLLELRHTERMEAALRGDERDESSASP